MSSTVVNVSRVRTSTTAENLKDCLIDVMQQWEVLEKVSQMTTDNAKNIKKAVELVPKFHVPCFAHCLNLVITHTLEHFDGEKGRAPLKQAREKVRNIVSYFHSSAKANRKLEEAQISMFGPNPGPLKLIQEVLTRWNSTYFMFMRFIELRPLVNSVLTDDEIGRGNLAIFDPEILQVIQRAVNAFEPIQQASEEMCGDKYPTISMVLPIAQLLMETTKEMSSKCEISAKVNQQLYKYFGQAEDNYQLAAAAFLDPRFKQYVFSTSSDRTCRVTGATSLDRVKRGLMAEFRFRPADPVLPVPSTPTPTSVTKRPSLWARHDDRVAAKIAQQAIPVNQRQVEMDIYLREPPIDRKQNPLVWWKMQARVMPEMYRLAKKYLCCPATSAPSERVFSKAGELISQRRANISDENIQMVLFLNKNL